MITTVSRSSLGLKSILKIPGLEPRTPRLGMLSECAYHLRYISIDPSAHTYSIEGTGSCGGVLSPHAYEPDAYTKLTCKLSGFKI